MYIKFLPILYVAIYNSVCIGCLYLYVQKTIHFYSYINHMPIFLLLYFKSYGRELLQILAGCKLHIGRNAIKLKEEQTGQSGKVQKMSFSGP